MRRWSVLLIGGLCYCMFLGVFLYGLGFVGGFVVPTRLDGPLGTPLAHGIAINLSLLMLFAVQHSVMARPAFKRWSASIVPAPLERSVYVLATNLVLLLLFWQWQPLGGMVWSVELPALRAVLWGLFACGWLIVLASTCLIHHFDLFGMRQAWLYFQGQPYAPLPLVTPGPYRYVRHPLYVGWLLAFWATPTMTVAHLLFAIGMTAYILVAIQFEERDLMQVHSGYREYRRHVPMLFPRALPWGGVLQSPESQSPESLAVLPTTAVSADGVPPSLDRYAGG
jgi:methanethiol S-methyltransferase